MSQGYNKNGSQESGKMKNTKYPNKNSKKVARGLKSSSQGMPPQSWGMKMSFKKKGRK